MTGMKWELVNATGDGPRVRRAAVPGGWLYQVEHEFYVDADGEREGYWVRGWHPPVFVPEVSSR